jgi:hypothetical protein
MVILGCLFLFGAGMADFAFGNGGVRETEYSTSLSEATGVVRIIVAVFGGFIGLLGIFVVFKGVVGKADISVSISEHRALSMKRISQGVVITLIGAGILVGALYFLPEKKTERELTGKEITIERESGKVREVMKK